MARLPQTFMSHHLRERFLLWSRKSQSHFSEAQRRIRSSEEEVNRSRADSATAFRGRSSPSSRSAKRRTNPSPDGVKTRFASEPDMNLLRVSRACRSGLSRQAIFEKTRNSDSLSFFALDRTRAAFCGSSSAARKRSRASLGLSSPACSAQSQRSL